jgi:HTH-type transcriptional regulator/antitoxin HigA
MELRPIRTKADYKAVLKKISSLLDAREGSREAGMLEVLSVLVEAYEEEHHPVDPPDPIEAIKFRMEQAGLTRRDLEPYLGSRARVSEVLNRKRPLSVEMIRRLNGGLGIPAEILIRPYKTGYAA